MISNSRIVRIEWQHCDPAGIVFYPRYFAIFDTSTTYLFEKALGMTKFNFLKKYDCAGYPMLDTRAQFHIATKFGDDVEVQTRIAEIKRSSFKIEHKLLKEGQLAVKGFEVRVWVGQDPDDPAKMKSRPIPEEVVAKLSV